jgi:mannose-1-phosphate guanylyltransferase
MIVPVIMCGGAGRRLWPLSTAARPKPFHVFSGQNSLFQNTLLRCVGGPFGPTIIVVVQRQHVFLVREQSEALGLSVVVVAEYDAHDTCVAALAGAMAAERLFPGQPIAILASDHHVPDVPAFQADFARSADAALDGHVVLHGIAATAPHTRFGYILPAASSGAGAKTPGLSTVSQFIEKPDAALAQTLQDRGAYWNSGNVVVLPQTLLAAATVHVPHVVRALADAISPSVLRGNVMALPMLDLAGWVPLPLDRAVLERAAGLKVVAARYGWSDLGTWDAIRDLHGSGGDFVHSNTLPVVVLGLEGVIVIATDEGILVTREGQSARMGEAVAAALARKS